MSDELVQLERRLRALATRLDLPAGPDLGPRVRARLEVAPPPRRRVGPLRSLRPAFVTALAVLLLTTGALVFSPTTRNAVADWIGLDGLKIGFGEPPAELPGRDLSLGRETTLQNAVAVAGFEIAPPAALAAPDAVYLQNEEPSPRVSFVYEADEALPQTSTTDVGLLLTAFRARLDEDVFGKSVGEGGTVERVSVDGSPGYWLTGDPHVLFYVDANGDFAEDRARLAGNTLVWQSGDIVYRLESALSMQRALEIARSVP